MGIGMILAAVHGLIFVSGLLLGLLLRKADAAAGAGGLIIGCGVVMLSGVFCFICGFIHGKGLNLFDLEDRKG
jgi:hypothetical protein